MREATLDRADFTAADLSNATLERVNLSDAIWSGVSFHCATLKECNLEAIELPARADFRHADLSGSLLTGSRMPEGQFRGANFQNCGLAEIEWPAADLRDADFTHASFHMGSSRSGLVGSTIPCEGSRTGFYTDEYLEQDFKPPEEIRKACLCDADLRGAAVEETDFYLVDLRGAQYSPKQARHFTRCGAILASHVA
jgi:uncharacterized protein YjbI with pentapeptide repeats